MAKKKTADKAAPKRKKARKQSRVLSGTLRRKPRTVPLPGMENLRIGPLDDICASISDTREQINQLKADEAGLETTALNLMRKHDRTTWKSSGVELIRVPGEERLRVKTSKANATAETEEDDEELQGADAEGATT